MIVYLFILVPVLKELLKKQGIPFKSTDRKVDLVRLLSKPESGKTKYNTLYGSSSRPYIFLEHFVKKNVSI
jgi:hypothetical protein